MTLNKNRLIEIIPTSKGTDWASWRDNVSHILSSNSVSGEKFLSPGDDNFRVDKEVHLLMDKDPKVFKSNNTFGTPINDFMSSNKTISRLTNVAKIAVDAGSAILDAIKGGGNTDSLSKSWQPWGQDIQAWKGARGGVTFEYEFNFALGQYGLWNAYEEVVKPVVNLVIPALPRNVGTFTMTGPFPNVFGLLTKMTQSGISNLRGGNSESDNEDNPNTEEDSNFLQKIGTFINDTLLDSYKNFTYTVKFGNIMTFERVYIENASANFSNKVDQNGWPIQGSANVTFKGMVPIAVSAASGKYGSLMTTRFGNS